MGVLYNELMPIIFYKNRFETPLESLNRLRLERPELATETLSYAGRLDPMAEGLLLVLVGEDENRDRQKYLHLSKTYEIEILFGLETDTYDLLGVVKSAKELNTEFSREKAQLELNKFIGEHEFPYPRFSSKVFSLQPTDEIPTRVMKINSIKSLEWNEVKGDKVKAEILEACEKVKGDFRQDLILNSIINIPKNISFQILKCSVACESGAYMRTLAHELGQRLATGAIAYRIKRVQIGENVLV